MYSEQRYGSNSKATLGTAYQLNYKGCLIAKVELSYKISITPGRAFVFGICGNDMWDGMSISDIKK